MPMTEREYLHEEIERLQRALWYWMPAIAGDGTPEGERAAEDGALLIGAGVDGDAPCWGDDILQALADVEGERDAAQRELAAWKEAMRRARIERERHARPGGVLNWIEGEVANILAANNQVERPL